MMKNRDSSSNLSVSKSQIDISNLSGVIKTTKSGILSSNGLSAGYNEAPSFVGFNASNLLFDGDATNQMLGPASSFNAPYSFKNAATLSMINVNDQMAPDALPNHAASALTSQTTLNELRNYSSLMDQFSLHNFLIWNGKALRNTPEFHSFRRTYDNDWGPISSVITALERLMQAYDIKLAIINGQRTAQVALWGLPSLEQNELLGCIANIEQIRPMITSFLRDGASDRNRAVTKIQSVVRQWMAKRKYINLKRLAVSALKVQSVCRMFLERCRAGQRMEQARNLAEKKQRECMGALRENWANLVPGRPLLLIHIPSVRTGEVVRLGIENIGATQNAAIAGLFQLDHPDVHVLYVCPCQFGQPEQQYVDKFLQVLGVSTMPKRLRFIVPDMLRRLPSHLPLVQMLWYCSATMRKIRSIAKGYANAFIVPTCVGWAEKKISNFLSIPLLGPDAAVAESLSGRSMAKQVFMDSFVNFPIGAHDIANEDDFAVSLSRLIASNLDVDRWLVRLNNDVANETVVLIAPAKLAIVKVLRAEQAAMIQRHPDNAQAWFSKHVQASARKRLVTALQSELPTLVSTMEL